MALDLPAEEVKVTGEYVPVRSVLFVCTGNTCRSPLAEVLFKKILSDRLGIPIDHLPAHGYLVQSAGVMAGYGDAASEVAVDVAREYGVDLSNHRSRPVNPEMLAEVSNIIAMTQSHLTLLMMQHPNVGPVPMLLSEEIDIPDPIGGSIEDYRECARVIVAQLDRLSKEWLAT
jgi:protein-tyrosine-phosphatase